MTKERDHDIVLAHHERNERSLAADRAKQSQRQALLEKADGFESLVVGRKFENEDLGAAGKALIEMLQEHPDMDMAVIQDLAAERTGVDETVVIAALWEQTDKGNLRPEPGIHFVLASSEHTIV